MRIVRPAAAGALQSAAVVVTCLVSAPALAQEFRGLLNSLSTVPNTYQGSSVSGNTITNYSRFQNISGIPFVITGVADVQSFDPEDLGFPDLTPDNQLAARRALAGLFPNYDLYVSTAWVVSNPPRRTWETEITFGGPFPILVNPGDEFDFTRVSRNDLSGPDFGPTSAPLSTTLTEFIGELVVAIDVDWHYVPEPNTTSLLICGVLLGLLISRGRPARFPPASASAIPSLNFEYHPPARDV